MQCREYLEHLIRFPSVSSESNVQITDCVQDWLKILRFDVERLEYTDDRGIRKACVIGRRGPAAGPGLGYFCHTDVVPVDSWSFSASGPWTPHCSENRIYGRGACDMRGSVACMLAAVSSIPLEQMKAPFYFAATADEEIGFTGARRIVEESALYREMVRRQCPTIIGEPTRLEVVYAHKGGRSVRATSIGKAAHSSTGLGCNANMALIPFLVEVQRLNQEMESMAEWRDERFQPATPTLNVMIHDVNTAINITSPRAECSVYFRPMPGQNSDAAVQRLATAAHKSSLHFEEIFCGHPVLTDPQSPFIVQLLGLAGNSTAKTVSYGTDGAVLGELKNLVILGPGDIAQAHTDDEWISLEQLERGTSVFAKCLTHWCC